MTVWGNILYNKETLHHVNNESELFKTLLVEIQNTQALTSSKNNCDKHTLCTHMKPQGPKKIVSLIF